MVKIKKHIGINMQFSSILSLLSLAFQSHPCFTFLCSHIMIYSELWFTQYGYCCSTKMQLLCFNDEKCPKQTKILKTKGGSDTVWIYKASDPLNTC